MSKKKKMQKLDLDSFFVYSTDPNYSTEPEEEVVEEVSPSDQKLFVRKERKGRGGKVVSIIEGFQGSETHLTDLAKDLKQHCGTGGSVKDGAIIIQGDIADKIVRFLTNRGYQAKKTTI
jgi:translation initiation factor 1